MSSFLAKADKNCLTKARGDSLCGKINTITSLPISLPDLKDMTKKFNLTVNDAVMCAASTGLKTLFNEKKDKSTRVNIVIPANIRFNFYKKRDDVLLENKFAAIPLSMPLTDSMEEGYSKI